MSEVIQLNLASPPLIKLPASAFPRRADIYFCDKCGEDITKHLHPSQPHVWEPIGPERYLCRCGQTYLTGAVEWDHLGAWKRTRRVRETLMFGVLFSLVSFFLAAPTSLVLYLVLRLYAVALVAGLFMTALPLVITHIIFWFEVIASVWRTSRGTQVISEW